MHHVRCMQEQMGGFMFIKTLTRVVRTISMNEFMCKYNRKTLLNIVLSLTEYIVTTVCTRKMEYNDIGGGDARGRNRDSRHF